MVQTDTASLADHHPTVVRRPNRGGRQASVPRKPIALVTSDVGDCDSTDRLGIGEPEQFS